MELSDIGIVARLQVQRTSLKPGRKPHRVYDTSPLVAVERLQVSPEGVVAALPGGGEVLDVHHLRHPASQFSGRNGVTVGFTRDYARLRARFGDHMWDGCAGENILVEAAVAFGPADLERGLVIRCADGELWLTGIVVAAPCVEFSRFSLRQPQADADGAEIKAALQFLDGGTRGYRVVPANRDRPLVVSLGDRVCLPRVGEMTGRAAFE